jgi:hypothetical protein
MNSGLKDHRSSIVSITTGDKYVFSLDIYTAVSWKFVSIKASKVTDEAFGTRNYFVKNDSGKYELVVTHDKTDTTKEYYYWSDNSTLATSDDYSVQIGTYTFSDGVYTITSLFDQDEGSGLWISNDSITEKAYKTTNIGIFIKSIEGKPLYIKDMQFYPYKTLEGSSEAIAPGQKLDAIIKE